MGAGTTRKGVDMSWQKSKEDRESKGYVALKVDGDSAVLLVLTEPESVRQPGMRGKPTTRFLVGVIDNGQVKVWDMSGNTLDALGKATGEQVPAKVVVTRRGIAGDPKTTYEIMAEPLTPADKGLCANPTLVREALLALTGGDVPF